MDQAVQTQLKTVFRVTEAKYPLVGFIVTVLLGVVFILVLPTLGIGQGWIDCFLILLMTCYCVCEYWSDAYYQRYTDRLGDNVYYLGLLFTLFSMAVSLYRLSSTKDQALDELISGFGIALATTIWGVFLRTWLYQAARETLEETSEKIRRELARFVGQVIAETNACLSHLVNFKNRLAASLTEIVSGSTKATVDAIQQALQLVEAQMKPLREAFSGLFEGFPILLEKLNEESSRLVSELEKVTKQIAAVRIPDNILTRELSVLSNVIKDYERTLGGLQQIAGRTAEQLDVLNSSLKAVTNTTDEQVQKAEERVKTVSTALSEALNALNQEIASLQQKIKDAANEIVKAEEKLLAAEQQIEQQIDALVERNKDGLSLIRDNRNAIEQELAKSRETLFKMHDSMVSLASLIIEKLQGRNGEDVATDDRAAKEHQLV